MTDDHIRHAPARTDYAEQLTQAGLEISADVIHYACEQWPRAAQALMNDESHPAYGLRLGSAAGEGVSLGPYLPGNGGEGLPSLAGDHCLSEVGLSAQETPWGMTAQRGGQSAPLIHASADELNLVALRGGPEPVFGGKPGTSLHAATQQMGPGTGSGTLLLHLILRQSRLLARGGHGLPLMRRAQGWIRQPAAEQPPATFVTTRLNYALWLAHSWTLCGGPDFQNGASTLIWDSLSPELTDPQDGPEQAWTQMLASAGSLSSWPQSLQDLRDELTQESGRTGRPAQGGRTMHLWHEQRRGDPLYVQRRVRLCLKGEQLIRLGVVQSEIIHGSPARVRRLPATHLSYGQWGNPA